MNHDITQQSIYVPTAEENEAFEHGYAAGKLAGERAERERCARITATPESTNEEVMRIARYDPTSWAAGYLHACQKIEERIRSAK